MSGTSKPIKVDPNSRPAPFYTPTNITGVSTTVIGTYFLHTNTFNKPVATGTVTILDVAPGVATTTVGTITVPASPMPVTLHYDIELTNGLTIVAGVAAQDITISSL